MFNQILLGMYSIPANNKSKSPGTSAVLSPTSIGPVIFDGINLQAFLDGFCMDMTKEMEGMVFRSRLVNLSQFPKSLRRNILLAKVKISCVPTGRSKLNTLIMLRVETDWSPNRQNITSKCTDILWVDYLRRVWLYWRGAKVFPSTKQIRISLVLAMISSPPT